MKLFVDSSFIIAYLNENDSLHEKSMEYVDLIESNQCYVNNLIVNEVITVLGNKTGVEIAIKAYEFISLFFNVINEYDFHKFNLGNLLIYKKYNTKLSFTDTSIIYCMDKEKIENLISFDKEFKMVSEINLIGLN